MARKSYYSSVCSSGLHRRCSFMLSTSPERTIWCACACHHEINLARLRQHQADRALHPDLQIPGEEPNVSSSQLAGTPAAAVDMSAGVTVQQIEDEAGWSGPWEKL